MRYHELAEVPCSITRSVVLLGDRWTLLLLKQAFSGMRRFTDFRETTGISRARLVDRLDRLVDAEVLERVVPDGRAHAEYRLTEKGHDLYPVLMALRVWGDRYLAPDGAPVAYPHVGCGGDTTVGVSCERCGIAVTARDVRPVPGPGLLRGA